MNAELENAMEVFLAGLACVLFCDVIMGYFTINLKLDVALN